ncbi:MAG: trigger factor [Candidatus Omnitrophota bacterium]|nr:trigger factor [Candidatus Omnitrophota bacterium]
MKSKVKSAGDCSTLIEIELKSETISKAFDEIYNEMTKVANIPGFRAGKAPIELVKKHYAKDAKEEALKRLVPDAYRNALKEHGIDPVGMPEISDVEFEEGKLLSFKARVDTRPKFKLKDYKGIKVEKKKVAVSDEDIRKTLDNLREMNAKYTVAEERPVRMGDYVVSDLDCMVEGKPIHKKRENLWLCMEKESMIPGLSEQMLGMKKGEEKDIEVTLPEKYPDKKAAGKKAIYHVEAKEIRQRQLPDLSDEFAKDLGKESLEELKKEIRKELESRAKMTAEVDMENQALNRLSDDNVFPVPAGYVERQLAFMVDNAKERLLEKGFKKEDLDKKDSEFRDKFKNDAVRQVRLLFILDDIANAEKIDVNEEDLKVAYASIAAQTGKVEDAVKEYYAKEGLVDNLIEKLREGKTIQFLVKNAQVTEK